MANYCSPALLLHHQATPLLCKWACLPAAVMSGSSLISAEEVKTGIANEKVYHMNYLSLSQRVTGGRDGVSDVRTHALLE